MTVKHDENGNGTVRLGARDWIGLLALIVSAAIGVFMRMDFVESRIDRKFETMRSEWTREAPSPAMWTKDSIAELRARISELEREVRSGK